MAHHTRPDTSLPHDTVLEAALAFARLGWHVFPVQGGSASRPQDYKVPAFRTLGGRSWSEASTTDPEQITAWYAGASGLGVAVDLAKSDLTVIDIDHPDKVPEALQPFLTSAQYRGNPDRANYIFRGTLPQARHEWGEVKSSGGYVVLPPSPHPIGGTYVWDGPRTLRDAAPLAPLVSPRSSASEAPGDAWGPHSEATPEAIAWAAMHLARQVDRVATAPQGERNNALNTAAVIIGHYVPHLLDPDVARDALLSGARESGLVTDDGDRACLATIRSGMTAGSVDPQDAPRDSNGVVLDIASIRFERDVALKAYDLRVLEAARDLVRREKMPDPVPLKDLVVSADSLTELPPLSWRVRGLLPAGGRMTIVSQRKTGKTTLLGNLAHSLLGGDPSFLGRFAVEPLSGGLLFMNYEVSERQIGQWLKSIGVSSERMHVLNLRGQRNPLIDDAGKADLVEVLRTLEVEFLVVDPFGRAYGGESQNDAAQVTPWLAALDAVAEEAGVAEVAMAVHAGWNGERSRGSTALEDWPDTIVNLVRDDHDVRYLRAEGRDVEEPEDRLEFDSATMRLRLAGVGSRMTAAAAERAAALEARIIHWTLAEPGCNVARLRQLLRDEDGMKVDNSELSQASSRLETSGKIVIARGARGAREHHPATWDNMVRYDPDA